MIDAAIGVLREAGMDGADIFFDRFEDAGSPAPVIDNLRCVLCDECLLVKPVENCIVEASNLTLATDGEVTGFERILPGHSSGLYYNGLFIDEAECIRCYACVDACPHDAISPTHDRVVNTLRQRTP
jgi:formate hydrogenlyase subunit 6/NADH:ubiquinone oxidoreductase subunit I